MKKILGLDIGTTSIGWAVVEVSEDKKINIETGESPNSFINNERLGIYKDAVGVRIISQDTDTLQSFNNGKKLNGQKKTPTATRRQLRGGRKLKSRYKLRRDKLCTVLELLEMLPDGSYRKVALLHE